MLDWRQTGDELSLHDLDIQSHMASLGHSELVNALMEDMNMLVQKTKHHSFIDQNYTTLEVG